MRRLKHGQLRLPRDVKHALLAFFHAVAVGLHGTRLVRVFGAGEPNEGHQFVALLVLFVDAQLEALAKCLVEGDVVIGAFLGESGHHLDAFLDDVLFDGL